MTEFEIGTTLVGLTALSDLTTPITDTLIATYEPYAEYRKAASGKLIGLGAPVATWTFPVLTLAQRDQLRTFCTGASATVFIKTATNDSSDAFADFEAVMEWPDAEERPAGLRKNLTVRFTHLVVQGD